MDQVSKLEYTAFKAEAKLAFFRVETEFRRDRAAPFKDAFAIMFETKPDFGTACVRFPKEGEKYHVVTAGFGITELYREGGSLGSLSGYLRLYFIHELGHILSLYPMMKEAGFNSIEDISQELIKRRIPFGLWNLAQDAHDEHFVREVFKIHFNWLGYEGYPKEPKTPESLLWCLVQNEGSYPEFLRKFSGKGEIVAKDVFEFYIRFISSKTLPELLDCLEAWMARFGKFSEEWGRGSTAGDKPASGNAMSDLGQSMGAEQDLKGDLLGSLVCDPQAQSKPIEDARPYYGPLNSREVLCPSGLISTHVVDSHDGGALDESPSRSIAECDGIFHEGRSLASQLKHLISRMSVDQPSRQGYSLDLVAELTGSPEYYLEDAVRSCPLKCGLVIDLSGSMGTYYTHNSLVLAAAFSELAKKKLVQGSIIFTKVDGKTALSTAVDFKNFSPSMASKAIANGSAEGIFHAIKNHQRRLRDCEIVYVATDGWICDLVLSPKQRQSILKAKVIGAYCGPNADTNLLNKDMFDAWLTATNIKELGGFMIKQFKSSRKK